MAKLKARTFEQMYHAAHLLKFRQKIETLSMTELLIHSFPVHPSSTPLKVGLRKGALGTNGLMEESYNNSICQQLNTIHLGKSLKGSAKIVYL